jgi:hypothetical protein
MGTRAKIYEFASHKLGAARMHTLWRRGGAPLPCLAADEARSVEWREQLVRLFLERVLPVLGMNGLTDTCPAQRSGRARKEPLCERRGGRALGEDYRRL